jgi:SpoVK/Ycf46/Vps4 family AAA+-type ATPase
VSEFNFLQKGARRRLERKIYIPLPDEEARAHMLTKSRVPQSAVDELAVKTAVRPPSQSISLVLTIRELGIQRL